MRRQWTAVLLLPLAVVVAVAGSSMYVQEYWWKRGFHQAAPVASDGSVTITDEYDDGFLRYPIEATVRLQSARQVTELPGAFAPAELPDGAALWELRLAWRADPDVSLFGCQVALFDTAGVQYVPDQLTYAPGAPVPSHDCVPDETPGPEPQVGSDAPPALAPGEDPRPTSWSTRVYVLTADDATPETVRVWWFLPRYGELPVG
jgi:hypothetical protein